MLENTNRISIQVGLSGYSFKIEGTEGVRRSGWMSSERIFTTPELQVRYDQVEIAVFTPKCALVPSPFYGSDGARAALEDVADLKDGDPVDAVEVKAFDAMLIYSNSIGETLSKVMSETVVRTDGSKVDPLPELYYILESLSGLQPPMPTPIFSPTARQRAIFCTVCTSWSVRSWTSHTTIRAQSIKVPRTPISSTIAKRRSGVWHIAP